MPNRLLASKFNCWIAAFVALATIVAVSLAAPASALAEGELAQITYTKDGTEVTEQFSGDSAPWDAFNKAAEVSGDVTIDVLADWDQLKKAANFEVPANRNFTLNLHGHMIDAGSSDDATQNTVLVVDEEATLVVNGGSDDERSTPHYGTLTSTEVGSLLWTANETQEEDASADILNGGLITGGRAACSSGAGGVLVKDGASLTLNSVILAGNKSNVVNLYYGHGGAISLFGDKAKLTVNSSALIYNYAEGWGGAIYVNDDESEVTITGGSDVNGNGSGKYGGAIAVDGNEDKLTVKDSRLMDNMADNNGGALYFNCKEGNVALNNAYLSKNSSKDNGGAIYDNYDGTIYAISNGTLFEGNTADNGGAVYLDDDSTFTLNKSTIKDCKATSGNGGGIYSNGTNANVRIENGATITGNNAHNNGGGIYLVGVLTLDNGHVVTNTADDGAGIYVESNEATITIERSSTVNENIAASEGGGIYHNGKYGVVEVNASSISQNQAGEDGGGIYNNWLGTVFSLSNGASINGNSAADEGGAIYFYNSGKLFLDNAKMEKNTAVCGGAVYVNKNTTKISLANGSAMNENKASNQGGAIYFNDAATLTLDASSINGNESGTSDNAAGGGALYMASGKTSIKLENGSTMSHNIAHGSTGDGGAIYVADTTTLSLDGASSIEYNEARAGGAIFVSEGNALTATMNGNSGINNNIARAQLGHGGAIGVNNANLTLTSKDRTGTLSCNTCENDRGNDAGYGGAISFYVLDSGKTLKLEGLTITGNTTAGDGGGVGYHTDYLHIDTPGTIVLTDCTITDNHAGATAGGVYTDAAAKMILGGKVVIDDNTASSDNSADNLRLPLKELFCDADSFSSESSIGISLREGFDESKELPCIITDDDSYNSAFEANSDCFFCDDDTYEVRVYDGVFSDALCIDKRPARELTIIGYNGDTKTESYLGGTEVKVNSADYPKTVTVSGVETTAHLDYWEASGIDGTDKIYPEDGVATFTMPEGKVTLRAHYANTLAGVKLTISDTSGWVDLGTTTTNTVGTQAYLTDTASTVKTATSGEARKCLSVKSVELADGSTDEVKNVTYTVTVHNDLVKDFVKVYSIDSVKANGLSVVTAFGTVSTDSCEVSQDEDGNLVLKGTVSVAKTEGESCTVQVNCHDINDPDSSKTIASWRWVARQGIEKYTVTAPQVPGMVFAGWNTIPGRATADGATLTIPQLKDSEYTAIADYTPEVSRAAVTMTLPESGELTPGADFERFVDTYFITDSSSTNAIDVTSEALNGQKDWLVYWYDEDGNEVDYDAGVQAGKTYTVKIVTKLNGKTNAGHYYAFSDSTTATVNGNDATFSMDTAARTQTISFTISSASAEPEPEPEPTSYDIAVTGGKAYDKQGNEITSAVEGAGVTLVADEPAEGKVFAGWKVTAGEITLTDETASTTTFVMGSAGVSVEATYEDGPAPEPAAAHDIAVTSGTACDAAGNVLTGAVEGTEVTLVADEPAEGKVFAGWKLTAGGVTLADASASTTTFTMGGEDVAVEATYEDEAPTTHSIAVEAGKAYDKDGNEIDSAVKDAEVTLVADEHGEGKVFTGWVVTAGNVALADASATTTTFTMGGEDVSVEATYAEKAATLHVVKFNSDGGSEVKEQQVVDGEQAIKPADPTKDGYTFAGWKLDGADYDFAAEVTSDIELMASWTENEPAPEPSQAHDIVVTGGTAYDASGNVLAGAVEGTEVTLVADEPAEGKVFAGWKVTAGGVTLADASASTTTFTMGGEEVAVEATYKDESEPTPTPGPDGGDDDDDSGDGGDDSGDSDADADDDDTDKGGASDGDADGDAGSDNGDAVSDTNAVPQTGDSSTTAVPAAIAIALAAFGVALGACRFSRRRNS